MTAQIYEVKVYYPTGELKKVIPIDKVIKHMWTSRGLPTTSYKEGAKVPKVERKCKYCDTMFNPTFKTSLICRSKICKQRHYRLLGAAPLEDKVCPKCKKAFKGVGARVYCNNPCKYTRPRHIKNIREE